LKLKLGSELQRLTLYRIRSIMEQLVADLQHLKTNNEDDDHKKQNAEHLPEIPDEMLKADSLKEDIISCLQRYNFSKMQSTEIIPQFNNSYVELNNSSTTNSNPFEVYTKNYTNTTNLLIFHCMKNEFYNTSLLENSSFSHLQNFINKLTKASRLIESWKLAYHIADILQNNNFTAEGNNTDGLYQCLRMTFSENFLNPFQRLIIMKKITNELYNLTESCSAVEYPEDCKQYASQLLHASCECVNCHLNNIGEILAEQSKPCNQTAQFNDTFESNSKEKNNFLGYTKEEPVNFDDVNYYEQQIEAALQNSLASTGRSLKALQESEDIGFATAQDLIVQGEKLHKVDKKLGDIQSTTKQTQRHLNSVKSLFGNIRNYFNKDKPLPKASEEEPVEKSVRNGTNLQSTVQRIKDDSTGIFSDNAGTIGNNEYKPTLADSTRQMIEGTRWGSMNQEIEGNLGLMENNLLRLKELGIALGEEVQQQNELIDRVARKADKTNMVVDDQNRQMRRILGNDKKKTSLLPSTGSATASSELLIASTSDMAVKKIELFQMCISSLNFHKYLKLFTSVHYTLLARTTLLLKHPKIAFNQQQAKMSLDAMLLSLLDDCSRDLQSKSVQKRLNEWIKNSLHCRDSAFVMVIDDYGHCRVQTCGSRDFPSPIHAGNLDQWAAIFEDSAHIFYKNIPKELQQCVAKVFGENYLPNLPVSLHAVENSNGNALIAILCIYHSTSEASENISNGISTVHELSGDELEQIRLAGSMIRIAVSMEQQKSRTKLNGFILTLLKNVFSNLENMAQLVQSIIKDAKKLIPSEDCSLYLIDNDSNELVAEVVEKDEKNEEYLKEIRFPMNEGIVGQVAVSGEMQNIQRDGSPSTNVDKPAQPLIANNSCSEQEDTVPDPLQQRMKKLHFRNMLCFAVKDKKNVIAVIQLLNKIGTDGFTSHDQQLAELLSSYCAISISHCLLFKRLQEANRRTHVASELMMYHTQKIAEEDVLRLSLCPVPAPSSFSQDFLSFFYSPRELSVRDTHMACLAMFYDLGYVHKFRIKRRKLSRFLLLVEKGYRDVPYHNWYHAFTVTHFCYLMLKTIPELRQHLTDVRCMCLLVACLCHDIDHRGTTNSFQVQSKTALAQLYSSEGSVLECHHFAQTMCILNIEECNIFAELPATLYQTILDNIRDIILATDLAQHLRIRPEFIEMVESGLQRGNPRHVYILLSVLMTACDLSDQMKPWKMSKNVAAKVYKEFFSQGDLEKAMGNRPVEMMDRDRADVLKLQIDFLDGIALPLYKHLSRLFPALLPVYQTGYQNRQCYVAMQKIIMSNSNNSSSNRYDIDMLFNAEIERQVEEMIQSATDNNSFQETTTTNATVNNANVASSENL
ncbi:cGMP-dependent 3',5'-cyclic phosphodiesterase, partial [Trichinella papuae]